ncbi:MAG TPA: HAD family hydrolase [Terracidiphilus sp.]|nr:HAD family hydrolase [Terracidiphilus sp.]
MTSRLENPLERISPNAGAIRARVVLFDFDGTLSLIRSGWEQIMIPMIVETLAGLGSGESEQQLSTVVEEYAARLTGEQTIYQMIELARQVELRGGKPLAPLEYKEKYHERLMERIRHRRESLRRGEVSPDEYLVPGAREFLEALRNRGLTLYCASGTDQIYTHEEAQLLQIAGYFDGGIYGALEDYKSFSKEILIRKLISTAGYRGEELLGFGDGYVEIKNVKDAGGLAVGVATDEPECKFVNEWKRNRLVAVGADFIVPNFLAREQILETVFGN